MTGTRAALSHALIDGLARDPQWALWSLSLTLAGLQSAPAMIELAARMRVNNDPVPSQDGVEDGLAWCDYCGNADPAGLAPGPDEEVFGLTGGPPVCTDSAACLQRRAERFPPRELPPALARLEAEAAAMIETSKAARVALTAFAQAGDEVVALSQARPDAVTLVPPPSALVTTGSIPHVMLSSGASRAHLLGTQRERLGVSGLKPGPQPGPGDPLPAPRRARAPRARRRSQTRRLR